jgi:hypothetical protein
VPSLADYPGYGDTDAYKGMLEAWGIDLKDPDLAEKFSAYGVDINDYATYTDGVWTFDYDAIWSIFSKTR